MHKILLGNKSRSDLLLVRELLEKKHFKVVEHVSAVGLDDSYDMIIADEWFLKERLNTIRNLRIRRDSVFLPILLMTADHNQKTVSQYLQNSIVDDLVEIPVQKPVLLARVENLLQRKELGRACEEQREELSRIYENTPLILLHVDSNLKICKANHYAARFIGVEQGEIIGKKSCRALRCVNAVTFAQCAADNSSPDCKRCLLRRSIISTLKTGKINEKKEIMLSLRQNGEMKEMIFLLTTTRLHIQGKSRVLITLLNITERKKLEEYKYIWFHDQLTGLYNRAFAEKELKRLDVERQLPISIIMADVNGLKMANDSFGHEQGDQLLKKVGNVLRSACRREDIIARWGGDEFIILLPQTKEVDAEKICKRISGASQNIQQGKIPVSIALGFAVKTTPDQDVQDIIKEAEEKMYKNKLTESRSVKGTVLNALLETLRTKSHETEEHACRLQKMALAIGQKIGLPFSELDRLSLLVSLHDIGKTSISEEILMKPGSLTEEEWKVMKKHPERGYRIASATGQFAHVAREILYHHERWDGSGYPEGLKGEEIPLLSRITAIVDAYDAMTNTRAYNTNPKSSEQALVELDRCAGSQFDPELVAVFVDIAAEEKLQTG